MEKVVVTHKFMGLFNMQVCAVDDATDEEILEVCNRENPPGTTGGWGGVIRTMEDSYCDSSKHKKEQLPVQCDGHADRKHYMIVC